MPSDWHSVTALPPLEPNELQLWRINLSEATEDEGAYRKHLSPTELARADRLRAGQVRLQFLVARSALRVLLSNLFNLPPTQVPITLNPYGKPETPPLNGLQVFFNCAHSRETILIGLCRTSEIGLDVEYLDRSADSLEIARNSFAPNEFRAIELSANPAERQRLFFHCWTRKEAVIKADGRGLSIPLSTLEVPVASAANSTPVLVQENTVVRTWFVSDISLGDELAAAFATSVPELTPHTFTFPTHLLSGDSLGT